MSRPTTDVLVVGGGPSGTAAAIRLARAGHQVVLVERRIRSWERARGDLLVPAAVAGLVELGVLRPDGTPVTTESPTDADGSAPHVLAGVRTWSGDRSIPLAWPSETGTPAITWPRTGLDHALRRAAIDAGVDVRLGTEAMAPIVERGFARGAVVRRVDLDAPEPADSEQDLEHLHSRFIVIADGARSRFGRSLGTHRDRRWPYAVTAAAYYASERGSATWSDTVLALPGPDGTPTTGHGWVNPVGDGRVSVGVNVLSSSRNVLGINVLKSLDAFAESVAERWGFDPTAPLSEPARVRTPLGGSVGPKMGPTYLVAGDAAGMANPFNGHGTVAALVTGRICAEVLDEALTVGNSTTLQRYPRALADSLGTYHKVARLSARFFGSPSLLSGTLRLAMRSDATMGGALRIAVGELRDGEHAGGAERAYRVAALAARFAPSW